MEKVLRDDQENMIFHATCCYTTWPTATPTYWNIKSVWSVEHFNILRDGVEHPLFQKLGRRS